MDAGVDGCIYAVQRASAPQEGTVVEEFWPSYRGLLAPSEQFLQRHVETEDGAFINAPGAITMRWSQE